MPALQVQRQSSYPRARRDFRPAVTALEGRELLTTGPVTFDGVAGLVGDNGYYRSGVTVTLVPYEPGYSADQLVTYYRVNGGPLTLGKTVTLTGSGFYDVTFISGDPAGHFGPVGSQFVGIDWMPPTVAVNATPNSLWPPNHKDVAVMVTGHISDNLSGVFPWVYYDVVDSEGQDQPAGFAMVQPDGNFSFIIDLQASRLGQDKNGRVYMIDVFGEDHAGNFGVGTTDVVVPHDQGNH